MQSERVVVVARGFFSLDDETVLQRTVGQAGESLRVGWSEAAHNVG